MKNFFVMILTVLIFSISLVGCTKSEITTKEATQNISTDTVEMNTPNENGGGYPVVNTDNGYPIGDNTSQESMYPIRDTNREYGPSFTIDEPINPDTNIVTGTGPAGVPIRLVDITTMGEELGLAIIEENGTYSFTLEKPLVSGHAVGLMIGDLSNTDFNYDEFSYSDEYIDKPMIGTLFYITVVP